MKLKVLAGLTAFAVVALIVTTGGPANAMTPHAQTHNGHVLEVAAHPYVVKSGPVSMMSQGQCSSYQYCAWTDDFFGGYFYAWDTYWNGTCVPTSGVMNDSISSFWNNMPSFEVVFYIDGGCSNPWWWAGSSPYTPPGMIWYDLWCGHSGCWNYEDAISSFRTRVAA